MGMSIGSESDDDDAPISAINTTPLVDVMLVLLIIFLITIPVVTHSVPVALPKQRIEARQTQPENIVLSVDAQGHLHWNELRLQGTEELVTRLKAVSTRRPQPEVQIRGDMNADYDGVGRIVYACQRAGITKVAFITEPTPGG